MLENKSADFADVIKPQQIEDTKKIGKFVIGKRLFKIIFTGKTKGKGTFGKVKSGTHEPTGEKVKLYSLTLCRLLLKFLKRKR